VDEYGNVLPEVIRCMEICAAENIALASGHSSSSETLALAKAAREVGVQKFIVTHATSDPWQIPKDVVKRCFEYGAFVEHSYLALIWGPGSPFPYFNPCPVEEMMEYIRICPEQTLLSSDLGTAGMILPDEGISNFMKILYDNDFTVDEIDAMFKHIPAYLMGLPRIDATS